MRVAEVGSLVELPEPAVAAPTAKAVAPKRARRWWILGVVGALALGAGGVAWSRVRAAPAGPRYLSERVVRADLDETIRATGSVQPVLEVQVGAQVSGRILAVPVDFNSRVKRGDLLAEIDATTYRSQVAQAEAALRIAQASRAQASANLVLTEQSLARARGLRTSALNAPVDLEQAVAQRGAASAAVRLAEAQIAQAVASLHNAQTSLSYTRIFAPIDGTVSTRSVDPGQTVAASFQTPTLFVIANDLTHMRVMADVDEANIGKLREGMSAVARVDAFPRESFRGTVSQLRITPTTTNGVVTYATVIDVENPARKLRPGMTATITVNTRHRAAVLQVPNAALRYHPSSTVLAATPRARAVTAASESSVESGVVYVLRGVAAVRVPVTIGITDGVRTEVEAPTLRAGDTVVLDETDATGARTSNAPRMRMF
jgi:HlyD family secretion protein